MVCATCAARQPEKARHHNRAKGSVAGVAWQDSSSGEATASTVMAEIRTRQVTTSASISKTLTRTKTTR